MCGGLDIGVIKIRLFLALFSRLLCCFLLLVFLSGIPLFVFLSGILSYEFIELFI